MSDSWICWSLFLDEWGDFLLKPPWTTCGYAVAVWYFFRFSDPKTQPISAILQLWFLESLWPLNSPPHRGLGWYRHTSSSRQICNILRWLEPLNYCPDDGNRDFQWFRSFLRATFYFVSSMILFCTSELYSLVFSLWWKIKGTWPLCSSYL